MRARRLAGSWLRPPDDCREEMRVAFWRLTACVAGRDGAGLAVEHHNASGAGEPLSPPMCT